MDITSESDTVELARTAIRELLATDRTLTVAALAREMGLGHQTLSHFVKDGSEVVPRPHVWQEIKKWWEARKAREDNTAWRKALKDAVPTANPYAYRTTSTGSTRGRTREGPTGEGPISPAFGAYYAGIAIGMAGAVRRSMQSAIEEQDRLMDHLALMTAELDRLDQPDDGSGSDRLERSNSLLSPEQIDDDIAAHDELLRKVEEGKKAKKPKRKTG